MGGKPGEVKSAGDLHERTRWVIANSRNWHRLGEGPTSVRIGRGGSSRQRAAGASPGSAPTYIDDSYYLRPRPRDAARGIGARSGRSGAASRVDPLLRAFQSQGMADRRDLATSATVSASTAQCATPSRSTTRSIAWPRSSSFPLRAYLRPGSRSLQPAGARRAVGQVPAGRDATWPTSRAGRNDQRLMQTEWRPGTRSRSRRS